ncbi:hypothetical protein ANCCAN_09943 [Ancylostoma caninum]|uniref:Uncharacterized protein n=1 Tax=Ancylostoma caninum TaxID=29170 RepID=A0A368GM15_ANCCA|nr:hypothetical protein ANCCAN_09943 [Ancylostoma caninum]
MNEHCSSQHGQCYEARSETFATENDFYCKRLCQRNTFSRETSLKRGRPALCSSFLKATFCGEVVVQYCTFHIGHCPLREIVDSADKATTVAGATVIEHMSCQQPLTLPIPENPDPGQDDHSSELPSPSYVFVTKKVEKEVGNDHNSPSSSSTESLKQSVRIKREVDIPIVLPSPPPTSNQTKTASYTTAAKVHVPETQDNWAEILNTALSDPSLSIQYKMLLQCLVASNRELKNVIAMMKSKQG